MTYSYHLGGSKIILKYAGKDATYATKLSELFPVKLMLHSREYEPIHPPNAIIDNLPQEKQ
jgi:L-lactate dehydrogenase (cytochrome)